MASPDVTSHKKKVLQLIILEYITEMCPENEQYDVENIHSYRVKNEQLE